MVLYELMELPMKDVATVLYELMELSMKYVATMLYGLMELHMKKMWLQCCMSSWSCQGKCAKGLV